MEQYKLRKLVIKPTLACTANCLMCSSRRELHGELIKKRTLSFEEWVKIFSDAKELGVQRLDISGGEPTLFKKLSDLIKIGHKYGWFINLNTNGSLITREFAQDLLQSGLNSVHVSIYSHDPEVHDGMRRTKGLWSKAISAVKIFSDLEREYPGFKTCTQTILCKENFRSVPDIIKLHHDSGSHNIAFTYLEGDFEKKVLLNEAEISYFKEKVIPEALEYCKKLDISIRNEAIKTIKNIFSNNILDISDWSKGIYRPKCKNLKPCSRPQEFTILLANGDVHPCNIVEYTHHPVMGNLFENSLAEIWHSDKWNEFRENLFEKCELCPIYLYMGIPLRSVHTGWPLLLRRIYHSLRTFLCVE